MKYKPAEAGMVFHGVINEMISSVEAALTGSNACGGRISTNN